MISIYNQDPQVLETGLGRYHPWLDTGSRGGPELSFLLLFFKCISHRRFGSPARSFFCFCVTFRMLFRCFWQSF